ncbi:MAG TPA: class I SAM-dependent methyltransferase [Planctomycetota bacterium]|nr:class I SAM-dependent methyltransferase [Planctomycetota bacterium]
MARAELPPITRRLGVTPRLRALAACVPHGTRVFADVGTNHGILPIAVLRAGRAQRCVAIDRSASALADTRRRLRRCRCDERVDLRLGDGLAALAPEEFDVVCMAGLGPRAMVAMLERDRQRLLAQRVRLVLNPIGGCAAPRAFLAAHGFELVAEAAVAERGRSYTILVAERLR